MSGKFLHYVIKVNLLIVVVFGFIKCLNRENEHSAEQFVTINVINMRQLISTFGKITLDNVFNHYFFNLFSVPLVAWYPKHVLSLGNG